MNRLLCRLSIFVLGIPVLVGLAPYSLAQNAALDDPAADDAVARVAPIRRLTPAEINRIRYCELRAMRLTGDDRPDPVTVKIAPKVIDEFLSDKKDVAGFQGERERREFLKLTPPMKLHRIAQFDKDLKYADLVEIQTDPEIFVQFRNKVMPIVLNNCATAGCHSSTNSEAVGFTLIKDPKKLPVSTYTNFVTLCQITKNKHAVIDRVNPEESLLLTYMLPVKDVKADFQHPGDVKYKQGVPNRAHNNYRVIESWIRSLKHPAEDYGVNLVRAPAVESQPADDDGMAPEARPPAKPKPKPGD